MAVSTIFFKKQGQWSGIGPHHARHSFVWVLTTCVLLSTVQRTEAGRIRPVFHPEAYWQYNGVHSFQPMPLLVRDGPAPREPIKKDRVSVDFWSIGTRLPVGLSYRGVEITIGPVLHASFRGGVVGSKSRGEREYEPEERYTTPAYWDYYEVHIRNWPVTLNTRFVAIATSPLFTLRRDEKARVCLGIERDLVGVPLTVEAGWIDAYGNDHPVDRFVFGRVRDVAIFFRCIGEVERTGEYNPAAFLEVGLTHSTFKPSHLFSSVTMTKATTLRLAVGGVFW